MAPPSATAGVAASVTVVTSASSLMAVVAVSALGALIGIKIAKELKKSGVLKK